MVNQPSSGLFTNLQEIFMSLAGIAVIVFAIAALGGAFLAIRHFTGKTLPMPVILLHGALAATGLVLLLATYFKHGLTGLAADALVLFLIAALGGFYLFSKQLRSQPLPGAVVVIHAGVAVTAFVLLASTLF